MKITKISIAIACFFIMIADVYSFKSRSQKMKVAEEYLNSLKQFNNKYDTGKLN